MEPSPTDFEDNPPCMFCRTVKDLRVVFYSEDRKVLICEECVVGLYIQLSEIRPILTDALKRVH